MAAIIPAIAAGVSLIGSGISAIGTYKAGQAQAKAYEYNAKMATEQAAYEEEQSREKFKQLMGQQKALYAKAGVSLTSGSPLLVLAEQASEAEEEALNIRYAGANQATMYKWQAEQAKQAGTIGAFGSFLSGLGMSKIWSFF
jgi:hypothetical protein